MNDDALRQRCIETLNAIERYNGRGVVGKIRFKGEEYPGLHLLWERADRILVVGFCWTEEKLKETREDFLYFINAITAEGVHKKMYLVLFYERSFDITALIWPVGISVFPIGLSEQEPRQEEQLKQATLRLKHIVDPPERKVGATHSRYFLTASHIAEQMLRTMPTTQLIPDLEHHVAELLITTQAGGSSMEEKVEKYLTAQWGE